MNFSKLIDSPKPLLIDYFAEWCGPCKSMAPVLQALARELGDEVRIVKVDIDKNPTLATKQGIRGVPTFELYKDGKLHWKESGMKSKQELLNQIKRIA